MDMVIWYNKIGEIESVFQRMNTSRTGTFLNIENGIIISKEKMNEECLSLFMWAFT